MDTDVSEECPGFDMSLRTEVSMLLQNYENSVVTSKEIAM
jgi:hypothetical protein